VHPAYDQLFDGFAPEHVRGDPHARRLWAVEQLKLAAMASRTWDLLTSSLSLVLLLGCMFTHGYSAPKNWSKLLLMNSHGVDCPSWTNSNWLVSMSASSSTLMKTFMLE
jgi:hypothetical protein